MRDRLAHTTDDVVKKARCACTHDVIQDGAEKADERRKIRKMLFQSPSQYHRMPKIRMRSPNVERNNMIIIIVMYILDLHCNLAPMLYCNNNVDVREHLSHKHLSDITNFKIHHL